MIPVICVVGKPNSGKTTLVEILVKNLRDRGYKIATIKHSHKNASIDTKGKDTWRHTKAGAEVVILSSPNKFALIKNLEKELQLDEILKFVDDVDLIIADGYKTSYKPKIAVVNSCRDLSSIKKPIFAIVCRKRISFQEIPCFNMNLQSKFITTKLFRVSYNFHDSELVNMIEDKFLNDIRKNGRKTRG